MISIRKEEAYAVESLHSHLRTYLGRIKRKTKVSQGARKHSSERHVFSYETTTEDVSSFLSTQNIVTASLLAWSFPFTMAY
jgi:hypothetical protein